MLPYALPRSFDRLPFPVVSSKVFLSPRDACPLAGSGFKDRNGRLGFWTTRFRLLPRLTMRPLCFEAQPFRTMHRLTDNMDLLSFNRPTTGNCRMGHDRLQV